MTEDFLLEIGCEELPSGAVLPLAEQLALSISQKLKKLAISFKAIQSFSTPRRLAVFIEDLSTEQPVQQVTKRGPARNAAYDKDGNPTPALLGFAKSCQVGIDALTIQENEKGAWFVYETSNAGAQTLTELPKITQEAIAELSIAKPMRWGKGQIEFVRPVHWVLMLFGESCVPATILGVKSDCYTYGHRFHAPQAIRIDHPRHYEAALKKAYVIADYHKRRISIVEQLSEQAKNLEGIAVMPSALVDEVCSIVEWPQAMVARFAPEFLQVPAEALIASMQVHQKCFPLKGADGQLLPAFILVSNIESNNVQQLIAGNEKVMRARLSDASFFFREDQKSPLATHMQQTAQVVYQKQLGSLWDKTQRVERIMLYLQPLLSLDKKEAVRACELAKCDLLSNMVGEFPELQGLMAMYYAKHDGESHAVAEALYEQYLPRFAGDDLPASVLGSALSLADRMDTLVGIFSIGQKPSGDKDPFKLRRHALAIVRILINQVAPLSLFELIYAAIEAYPALKDKEQLQQNVQAFILDRMQSYYQTQGIGPDRLLAIRACEENWLYDMDQRIQALNQFITLPVAAALSHACKRVNNILSKVEGRGYEVDEILLQEVAEQRLYKQLCEVETVVELLVNKNQYAEGLMKLADLRGEVDDFFNGVMIMVDEEALKQNRLALLRRLQSLLSRIADISLLQGDVVLQA